MQVDFINLADNGFDFMGKLIEMGWYNYFIIEEFPIYMEFIKEFWRFAKVTKIEVLSRLL